MLTFIFYVIVLWVLFSFGVGVYSYISASITHDRAVAIAVNTLRLPYDVVVKLFK